MPAKKDWYCGGYGGRHFGTKGDRPWFACPRCRWNPNYRDPPEKRGQVTPAKP